jgi:hypothetical protein
MSKPKKQGFKLEMKHFTGKDRQTYLVFRTTAGSFHVFTEAEAKEAARQCGATSKGNTRQMWNEVWKQ